MDLLDQTPIIATQILPSPTEPPAFVPPPKKSPILPIFVGLFIPILFGFTVFFAYQYFTLKSQLIVTPTPTPTVIATDPTADWKTYENQLFSLKYPNTWEVKEQNISECRGPQFYPPLKTNNWLNICSVDNQEGLSGIKNTWESQGGYSNISLKTINGINTISSEIQQFKSQYEYNVQLEGSSNRDILLHLISEIPEKEANKKILDLILSTFKFVDATNPEIILSTPKSGATITSPVTIKGTAPKGWTFESILNVSIEDDQHQLLSGGPVSTEEITGSDNLVSFETSVNFASTTDTGYITIKNDNPSGLPENDKSFSLPIRFVP